MSRHKHRIRGAAVVVDDDRLLLALHDDPTLDLKWWSPPGGTLDPGEDVLECAVREAMEETSLRVVPERPIYAQELEDRHTGVHTLELFVLCRLAEGVAAGDVRAAYEITEARFVSRDEARDLLILPAVFAGQFWDDFAAGFPELRHLGTADVTPSG